VREALKESLATSAAAATPAAGGFVGELRAALARGRPARLSVSAGSNADLDRFAKAIAEACSDDALKALILSGDVHFELARTPAAGSAAKAPAPTKASAFEMSSGVLSEAKIVEISRTHRMILVGSDVVMTPLARDKAREMKVELVRQKP
jgi:hypothetical protein